MFLNRLTKARRISALQRYNQLHIHCIPCCGWDDIIEKYNIVNIVPAKAVDVEVESKVEQLEVVGNSSENLRKGCEYQLLLKLCFAFQFSNWFQLVFTAFQF